MRQKFFLFFTFIAISFSPILIRLKKIYAMRFRNPHRFAWDRGKMITTCIGQHFLEEVNMVLKGANYGWAALKRHN